MRITELKLTGFRNHATLSLRFDESVVAFCGKNGTGKTNVLEAIHLLCMCRTYLHQQDQQNIRHGDPFFSAFGRYLEDENRHEVACQVERGKPKVFRYDKKEYQRLSAHIGKMPVVFIAPGDIELIHGGSEERRRFMDLILSQTDPVYLQELSAYQKALDQRNRQLKLFSERGFVDSHLLASLNHQLISPSYYIYDRRKEFTASFLPYFLEHHANLTQQEETPDLIYQSPLHEKNLEEWLRDNESQDLDLGRTSSGLHKDDLEPVLNHFPLKKFGSQGQVKTFLIALKLAQFDYLREKTGKRPFLLLDDIFEKLDEYRSQRLMQLVAQNHFGQIFITDTHRQRVEAVFAEIGKSVQIFGL